MSMITRKTWKEFRETNLLWWINRILHTFGWAIIFNISDDDGTVTEVYPARVKFRGFHKQDDENGFTKLTKYMSEIIPELQKELEEDEYVNITYRMNPDNIKDCIKFIGDVPPCPICNDTEEYDDNYGTQSCDICNSRCLPFINYKGERQYLDWDETIERREDGLHLVTNDIMVKDKS